MFSVKLNLFLFLVNFRIASPEQVVYEESEYHSHIHSYPGTIFETAVGPHLFLELLVSNKGPTTAARIDIVADWPFDPLRNNSLLYLVETPYLTRGRGRCYAGPAINSNQYQLIPPKNSRLNRPVPDSHTIAVSSWNDDPYAVRCYILNVAAGDYARIVLRTRVIAKSISKIFASERSMSVSTVANVVKLPGISKLPANQVVANATTHIEVITKISDFSLAHVDLWIIAVALGAGLLTVLLILLSLWLAGCFDRKVKRPKANYVKLATFEPTKAQALRVPMVGE